MSQDTIRRKLHSTTKHSVLHVISSIKLVYCNQRDERGFIGLCTFCEVLRVLVTEVRTKQNEFIHKLYNKHTLCFTAETLGANKETDGKLKCCLRQTQ